MQTQNTLSGHRPGLNLLIDITGFMCFTWISPPHISHNPLYAMVVINEGESLDIAGIHLPGEGLETVLQSESWTRLSEELKRRGDLTG